MADLTLIEQNKIGSDTTTGNFYLKLSTDSSNQNFVTNYTVINVSVTEQVSAGSPLVSITVIDIFGDLVNHRIIEGDFEFDLILSNTPDTTDIFRLLPSHITSTSLPESRHDNLVYTIHFVTEKWNRIFNTRPNRAWVDKKYSDIVQEIADEIGFTNTSITPTKETIPLVIQPYWTNYQMLNWIKSRCTPSVEQNSGYFDFALTVNNGFYFKSIGEIIRQKYAGISERTTNEIKKIFMDQRPQKDIEQNLRKATKLEIDQNYMTMMLNGGSGMTSSYYDYMNKSYVQNDPTKFSDSKEPQLSDWAYISGSHESAEKRIYGFLDSNVESQAKNKVSDAVNSLQKVRAVIEGVADIYMGEVVEVQIPLSPENSRIVYNEYFSGYYVVTMRKTFVNLNSNIAQTVLGLSRQGVNGTEINNLVQNTKGKFI